jgi:hypothetical protein
MKEAIGWLVATAILGLIFYVVEAYVPKESIFATVFRVMVVILALICLIGFLLAVIAYFNIPLPW